MPRARKRTSGATMRMTCRWMDTLARSKQTRREQFVSCSRYTAGRSLTERTIVEEGTRRQMSCGQ